MGCLIDVLHYIYIFSKVIENCLEDYCETKFFSSKEKTIKQTVLTGYSDETYRVKMKELKVNSIGFVDPSFQTPCYFNRYLILKDPHPLPCLMDA